MSHQRSPCFFASLKKWSCRVFLVHAATTGWALQAAGRLIMPAMLPGAGRQTPAVCLRLLAARHTVTAVPAPPTATVKLPPLPETALLLLDGCCWSGLLYKRVCWRRGGDRLLQLEHLEHLVHGCGTCDER